MSGFVLDDFLPYQLAVVAERISREYARRYREKFGISIPEWRVVAHLSQAGSVSVREVYEKVAMDKPKVSRAAQRLEAAGYLTKRENPKDRRLVELSLTPKGRRMVAAIAPIARDYEAEVMRRLGDMGPAFRGGLEMLMHEDCGAASPEGQRRAE